MSRSLNVVLMRRNARALTWFASALIGLTIPVTGRAAPGETEAVSLVTGAAGGAVVASCARQCTSSDGRYVVFQTQAPLEAGDTNGLWDIYVRDRLLQETRLVSRTPDGGAASGHSQNAVISADGRYVAFESGASDLVADDTNGAYDVFVRNLAIGVTERVSLTATGTQAPGFMVGGSPTISADGRFVAFYSNAALTPDDTAEYTDVYLRDRTAGITQRVSLRSDGVAPNEGSWMPSISADGRFVAFSSQATNFVEGDINGTSDVFVRDTQTGAVELIGVGYGAVISEDGRHVAFQTTAPLVPDDTNGRYDIYVRDRALLSTQRASLGIQGRQSKQECVDPGISADGRMVVFRSPTANLVDGDTNHTSDVFVRDLIKGTTERASVATSGLEGNSWSGSPTISPNGSVVTFTSAATNFGNDTSGAMYVHEIGGPHIKSYTLDPASVSFGNQTITTARTVGVAVVNTGTVPIWVSSVSLSGPAKTSFALSNVCHGWVQPTLRCRTGVTFKPATIGSKVASVVVSAGGIVPSVPLSGTGVLASYTATPSTLTFGSVALGTVSAAQKVVITNTGLSVLPIKSITLGGVDISQFRRSSDCPNNVPAGGSCTARVRFAPTTVGARTATLTITVGGGGGQRIIRLAGTGL
jgi:Tol biopolymer transport system component